MERTLPYPIVLAGDYGYIRQIETTLKSICANMSPVKVYVFNKDIPKEWFKAIRYKLRQLDSEILDVKLLDVGLREEWTSGFSHINYMTFARYFIPSCVPESKVLYLDSDIIISGGVTELFSLDLEDYYVAATPALHGMTSIFNAGVMLINNDLWRQDNIQERLLETTSREWENVNEGDQSILNMVFEGRYLHLDQTYNFPIGYDYGAFTFGQDHVFEIPIDPLPKILHYISPDKPWKTYSSGRLRHLWWHYANMEWHEIIQSYMAQKAQLPIPELSCFTLTDSQSLEQVEYLIQALPTVHFVIGAYTNMGERLLRLAQYDNVTLRPNMIRVNVEEQMRQADVYLDINHDNKHEHAIDLAKEHGLDLISFDNTQNPYYQDKVFPSSNAQTLVDYLKATYHLSEQGLH